MKKVLNLIGQHLVILGIACFVYFNVEYAWFFKAFLYVLLPPTILSYIFMFTGKHNETFTETLEKRKSKVYMTTDIILDIIYLFVFAIMDYKALFVLQVIIFTFNISLYHEKNKEKQM